MAITNYELEAVFFSENPGTQIIIQDLLVAAADYMKYRNSWLRKYKKRNAMKKTRYLLNELSKYCGTPERTRGCIAVVKEIYPNWQDAYIFIDILLENGKK